MKKICYKSRIPAINAGKIILLFLFVIGFCSCASKNEKQPNDIEIEMKLLDKRLGAVEEKIDKLYSRLSIIQFMVDNHEQMIKAKPESLSSQETATSQIMPENTEKVSYVHEAREENLSPQKLYSKGYNYLKNKNYAKSIDTFDEFLKKYPNETLADNALYWKGEAFYAQSDYKKSAEIFELVTTTYPEGTKCPDALLKAGYSYLMLKNNEKAKELLQKVIKIYPFSNAAPKAQSKLKEIL